MCNPTSSFQSSVNLNVALELQGKGILFKRSANASVARVATFGGPASDQIRFGSCSASALVLEACVCSSATAALHKSRCRHQAFATLGAKAGLGRSPRHAQSSGLLVLDVAEQIKRSQSSMQSGRKRERDSHQAASRAVSRLPMCRCAGCCSALPSPIRSHGKCVLDVYPAKLSQRGVSRGCDDEGGPASSRAAGSLTRDEPLG